MKHLIADGHNTPMIILRLAMSTITGESSVLGPLVSGAEMKLEGVEMMGTERMLLAMLSPPENQENRIVSMQLL
jgi:hypothetical protein